VIDIAPDQHSRRPMDKQRYLARDKLLVGSRSAGHISRLRSVIYLSGYNGLLDSSLIQGDVSAILVR